VNNITEHFDARARLRRFLGNGKCPAHAEAKPPGFGHIYFHRTTSCMGIRNCCSNELAPSCPHFYMPDHLKQVKIFIDKHAQ
jgi:hypothetical protein